MSNNGLGSQKYGPVAQLGERCPCKAEAPGSNPGGSINLLKEYFDKVLIFSFFVQHLFCGGIVCEGMIFFLRLFVH